MAAPALLISIIKQQPGPGASAHPARVGWGCTSAWLCPKGFLIPQSNVPVAPAQPPGGSRVVPPLSIPWQVTNTAGKCWTWPAAWRHGWGCNPV